MIKPYYVLKTHNSASSMGQSPAWEFSVACDNVYVLQQLETEGSLSAEELSGLAKVSITLATERYTCMYIQS